MTEKQLEKANKNKLIQKNIDEYLPYVENMGDYELRIVKKGNTGRMLSFNQMDLKEGDIAYINSLLTIVREDIATYMKQVKYLMQEDFKSI